MLFWVHSLLPARGQPVRRPVKHLNGAGSRNAADVLPGDPHQQVSVATVPEVRRGQRLAELIV